MKERIRMKDERNKKNIRAHLNDAVRMSCDPNDAFEWQERMTTDLSEYVFAFGAEGKQLHQVGVEGDG